MIVVWRADGMLKSHPNRRDSLGILSSLECTVRKSGETLVQGSIPRGLHTKEVEKTMTTTPIIYTRGSYKHGRNLTIASKIIMCQFLADNSLIYIIRNWCKARYMRKKGEI